MPVAEESPPGPALSAGRPPWLGTPPPFTTIWFGKARPVVLPKRAVCSPPKPHWMPKSREKFRLVTTIRASISTCGVAVSSSAIRPFALST